VGLDPGRDIVRQGQKGDGNRASDADGADAKGALHSALKDESDLPSSG